MSTLPASLKDPSRLWMWIGGSVVVILILAAVSTPRYQMSTEKARQSVARMQAYQDSNSSSKTELLSAGLAGGVVAGRVSTSGAQPADRKIVRTTCMEVTVASPADAAEKIRAFAESLGGYVETAQINSSQDSPSATITIRVPAARLEDAKAELRKLSVKVNSEKTDAQDVTRQYVDMEARIRNLRAEEAQYLEIMRSAKKVPDMLDVSEKLSGVRGEIEQQQAEFAALSKQVETVAITISLLPQALPESFSVNWKPLRTLKVAYHDALEGLADYASAMLGFLLYLPVIALWVGTVLLGALAGWRTLRWVARVFVVPKPAVSPTQPN